MTSPNDLYLTAGQVAEFLHVSTKTVHRWASQGLLRCTFTLGGHRRFRLSDVESAVAMIEERRDQSGNTTASNGGSEEQEPRHEPGEPNGNGSAGPEAGGAG